MAHINFVLPHNKKELLSETDDQYYVKNIIRSKEIHQKLRESKACLKDEGTEFILENFDTYFSIILDGENLPLDVILRGNEDLQRAATDLDRNLKFLLEDKDSLNEEIKAKYQNILKMLMYVYTNMTILVGQKAKKQAISIKKGRKISDDGFGQFDRSVVLTTLSNIMERDIDLFWDPPVVESVFTSLIADVAYRFLESPSIKSEKESRAHIFNLLGLLLKKYNHGDMFVLHMVNLIKVHEHLANVIPEGIRLIIQNYNCKGLLKDLIKELTEWQTDEKFYDAQGSRNCCSVLSEMAVLMPTLIVPEVMYLNDYLGHDSYSLRISVLNVIVEVVINVLTKHDLTDEERGSRDDLLWILEEHILDVSAIVRSKVCQFWSRLQSENAVPKAMQAAILQKILPHVKDKSAVVRKNATNTITTFLSTNPFMGELQLAGLEQELENENDKLTCLKYQQIGIDIHSVKNNLAEWSSKEKAIKEAIQKTLEKDSDFSQASSESNQSGENAPELLKSYVNDGEYEKAVQLSICAGQFNEKIGSMESKELEDNLLLFMKAFYVEPSKTGETPTEKLPTEAEVQEIEAVERTIEFLKNAVTFLKLIDQAIEPIKELLESATVGDMQEAISFFVAAYQFKIERASEGIYSMLKMMKRNDNERKEVIIEAFRKIYLQTDAPNMDVHTDTIVKRLIELVKKVPMGCFEDLADIVAQWVKKAHLDNNIINLLWNYVTRRIETTQEHVRLAVDLLYMCAKGRWTIIERNRELVHQMTFGEKGSSDMLLIRSGCRLLSLYSCKKHNITDKEPPLRIKHASPLWDDLLKIIVENFTKDVQYFNVGLTSAIDLIYKVCSSPDVLCERIITNVLKAVAEHARNSEDPKKLEVFIIIRLNHLLGEIAVRHMVYLDLTVYKELKRRNHLREERKNEKKSDVTKKNKQVNHSASSRNKRHTLNVSLNSTMNETEGGDGEESTLEGAQADDSDAEFILHILENYTVTSNSGLGKFTPIILRTCENLEQFNDVQVHITSVVTLMRYMIISSKFCEKYLRLIFTILEKSIFTEVKCHVLFHCADLLERFPNIVEPWTPKMYERLKDENCEVRRTAFYVLASLILRDMIRVQTHIAQMAMVIVDKEDILKMMSKEFFVTLSHKANNLYNALPDIFSHLAEESKIKETDLRFIMKFMFGLIDKSKHMENLVDRFCAKFHNNDNAYKYRNVAYCLTLITYNDKGLRKLSDNFRNYKHILQDDTVYAFFKQIIGSCIKSGKADLKAIISEIEEKINTVFELNEDGEPPRAHTTPAFKRPKNVRNSKKGRKKKSSSSDSSDSEAEFKKPKRPVKNKRKIHAVSSDSSDSDEDNRRITKSSTSKKTKN